MSNEAETCRKYVLPRLIAAGWDEEPHSFTEQRTFTDRSNVPVGSSIMGKSPNPLRDILLCHPITFPFATDDNEMNRSILPWRRFTIATAILVMSLLYLGGMCACAEKRVSIQHGFGLAAETGKGTGTAGLTRATPRRGHELVLQTGHTGPVASVAFSPKGDVLATGSFDHTVRIWDTCTGDLIRILAGHRDIVLSVAFSPDGSMIASGGQDFTVKIWDAASGKLVRTLTRQEFAVHGVAFTSDSKTVMGNSLQEVRFWDVATGKLRRCIRGAYPDGYPVSFSPDGLWIASGDNSLSEHVVTLSSAVTGKVAGVLRGHTDWIPAVAFSPSGRDLASGSHDGTVRIWDVRTRSVKKILRGHTDFVLTVAFSPSGKLVASAGRDNTIRIWDTRTGKTVRTLTGHTDFVHHVAFSPDGSMIASGGDDRNAMLWDLQTGKMIRSLQGCTTSVNAIAISPDGDSLISGSNDGILRVWSCDSPKLQRALVLTDGEINAVAISHDDKEVSVAGGVCDAVARVWDRKTDAVTKIQTHGRDVWALRFSPDGSTLLTAGGDATEGSGIVEFWNTETGALLKSWTNGVGCVRSVATSLHYRFIALAIGTGGNDLELRDADSGGVVRRWSDHAGIVESVAFSPDGQTVACGDLDMIRLRSVESGKDVGRLSCHGNNAPYNEVTCIAFSPNGELIAAATTDNLVRVWNVTAPSRPRVLAGHTGSVWSTAFFPDNQRIASGSDDGTIRIWNTHDGHLLVTLVAVPSMGESLNGPDWIAFSPEGNYDCTPNAEKLILCRSGGRLRPAALCDKEYHRSRLLGTRSPER